MVQAMNLGNHEADPFCHRCRSEPTYAVRGGVCLCRGCAIELLGPMVGEEIAVGQEGIAEGAAEGPQGHTSARSTTAQDAGKAIEKTANAAGEIAKTVKVVAVIVGVAGVAWVGYALWKASREATALQGEAKHAFLAHPELLRL